MTSAMREKYEACLLKMLDAITVRLEKGVTVSESECILSVAKAIEKCLTESEHQGIKTVQTVQLSPISVTYSVPLSPIP